MTRLTAGGLALACVVALAAPARAAAPAGPSCPYLLAAALKPPADLTTSRLVAMSGPYGPGDAEPCVAFAQLAHDLDSADAGPNAHVGLVGGRRAAVWLDGPGGSARIWEVTLLVDFGGGKRLGQCWETTTVAWRNLANFAERFSPWRPLAGDHFIFWRSVGAHATPGPGEFVLAPVVMALRGERLAYDEEATRELLGQVGQTYGEVSQQPDDEAAPLHRVAAQAFGAAASHRPCPTLSERAPSPRPRR